MRAGIRNILENVLWLKNHGYTYTRHTGWFSNYHGSVMIGPNTVINMKHKKLIRYITKRELERLGRS